MHPAALARAAATEMGTGGRKPGRGMRTARENTMDVDMLFKIAGVGIVAAIITQLLKQSGRDELATVAAVAGLIIGLMMMLSMVEELLESVRSVFSFY